MIEIFVPVLLGGFVGFLLAKFILVMPTDPKHPFITYLTRYGLGGSFAIGTPIVSYFTILEEVHCKYESILSYFLALFCVLITFASFACWLIVASVPSKLLPPDVAKAYRRSLVLKLLLEGYPAAKRSLRIVDDFIEKCITQSSSPHELYQQIKDTASPAERQILDLLRCSPSQFQQICEAIRKHYRPIN